MLCKTVFKEFHSFTYTCKTNCFLPADGTLDHHRISFLKTLSSKNRKKMLIAKRNSLPDMILLNNELSLPQNSNKISTLSVPGSPLNSTKSPKSSTNTPKSSPTTLKKADSLQSVAQAETIAQLENVLETVKTALGNFFPKTFLISFLFL